MKTIIVPTDFSMSATVAMNYAVEMAKTIEARILLVNVYQLPVTYADMPLVSIPVETLQQTSEERLEEWRQSILHITSGDIQVDKEAIMGNIVDELEEICNNVQPFAVVMGSKGTSPLERIILGSTVLIAIRSLKWPVIVVPQGSHFRKPRKIGLACDFKDVVSSLPVAFIKTIVREFKAELHVLNVDSKLKHFTHDTVLESAYFDALLGDIHPEYHFIHKDDVEKGLNAFAETNNLDMLIVIPKKHRLPAALFHKSHSRELISHAHIPIMTIHE
jgi:nucleotide-binding universal stress UspA family protein